MHRSRITMILWMGLFVAGGCSGESSTTYDFGEAPPAAREAAASAPAAPRPVAPAPAPARPTPPAHAADPAPTDARFSAEQIELRSHIADLERELGLTAHAADDIGGEFEAAMESLEAELEDYRLQLKIISGCDEEAETTEECPALGA